MTGKDYVKVFVSTCFFMAALAGMAEIDGRYGLPMLALYVSILWLFAVESWGDSSE